IVTDEFSHRGLTQRNHRALDFALATRHFQSRPLFGPSDQHFILLAALNTNRAEHSFNEVSDLGTPPVLVRSGQSQLSILGSIAVGECDANRCTSGSFRWVGVS